MHPIYEFNRFYYTLVTFISTKPESWSDDEMREGHIQYDDFYLSNERF